MIQTKTNEDIEIKSFNRNEQMVQVVASTITVPAGTSELAIAAMLKGLAEHFFDVIGSGDSIPPDMRNQIDRDLTHLKEKNLGLGARLIVPS